MSARTDPSSPEGRRAPQSEAPPGALSTPNKPDQPATDHSQRRRIKRTTSSQNKPQYSGYQNSSNNAPSALQTTDKEPLLGGEANEYQDSSQARVPHKQQNKRNKNSTPYHKTDQTTYTIPALDGTVSPTQQPASRTPSAQIPQATPIKQVYAGPTFHASPAASALPMPKFLARSVSSAPQPSILQERLDDELDRSDSPTPNAEEVITNSQSQRPPLRREESPLDIFFNAHRAEQARQGSSEGLGSTGLRSRQLLTPASADRGAYASTSRDSSRHSHNDRPSSRGYSDKAMFMMELDGTGEVEVSEDGRPPSLPFKDRLGAVRSASSLSQTQTIRDANEKERMAKSRALRRLLMAQQNRDTQGSPLAGADQAQLHDRSLHRSEPQVQPEQQLSVSAAPSREIPWHTPAPSQPCSDFTAMEMDLKRILKLDP